MEYVYLMTNEHVPELVKFGYSTRDPQERADELSSPTGVPGKWEVYRYWEVVNGYVVEQAVYKLLSEYRVGRQEFLELSPSEASRKITHAINKVGIDPVEKAKQEFERNRRKELEKQERIEQRKKDAQLKIDDFNKQYEHIHKEISEAKELIYQGRGDTLKMCFIFLVIVLFLMGINGKKLHDNDFINFIKNSFQSLVFSLTIFIPIVFFPPSKKFERRLKEAELTVLKKHGFKSIEEIRPPEYLLSQQKYGN